MTQHEIAAMSATFELKDVIYIVVGVGSALGFYWKMVMNNKENKTAISQVEKDLFKNETTMLKKFSGVHIKFEKTEEKMETHNEKHTAEFSAVNKLLGSIDGKLDMILQDRKK